MKSELIYVFYHPHLQAPIFIYQLSENLEMSETAHFIRMQKNPQTREHFSGFSGTFMEFFGFKVQLAPPHGNFNLKEFRLLSTVQHKVSFLIHISIKFAHKVRWRVNRAFYFVLNQLTL